MLTRGAGKPAGASGQGGTNHRPARQAHRRATGPAGIGIRCCPERCPGRFSGAGVDSRAAGWASLPADGVSLAPSRAVTPLNLDNMLGFGFPRQVGRGATAAAETRPLCASVAPLQGARSRCAGDLRLLRPAGVLRCALIVCAISFGMINVGESEVLRRRAGIVCKWIAVHHNPPTKPGYVLRGTGENIEIFGPAPKVQEFATGLDVQKILRRDCWCGKSWSETPVSFHVWWDESRSSLSLGS